MRYSFVSDNAHLNNKSGALSKDAGKIVDTMFDLSEIYDNSMFELVEVDKKGNPMRTILFMRSGDAYLPADRAETYAFLKENETNG